MTDTVSCEAIPSLATIWCLHDMESQICITCHKPIYPEALIRTFRVEPSDTRSDGEVSIKEVFVLGHRLSIYDRHLNCVYEEKVNYISVSHIWDKKVSIIQKVGAHGQDDQGLNGSVAARIVFDNAIKTYEGIAAGYKENQPEVWHDYISVPQWNDKVKVQILLKIPEIYYHSSFTVVHMHDVDRVSVDQYRSLGCPLKARLKGITDICSAHWFKRVWTAMEYIRSRQVRIMMKGYKLFDDGDDLFLDEMLRVWNAETALSGSVRAVERKAQMGRNLVPWQLGDLTVLRRQKREKTIFAEAYSHIVLRGCSTELDFFYAIVGLLGSTSRLQDLERNPKDAHWQIIKTCLRANDYSPLLLVPDMRDRYPVNRYTFGLIDVTSWGLGEIISPAHKGIELRNGRAAFQANKIGRIHKFKPLYDIQGPGRPALPVFASISSVVLEFTGPNVEDFASTIGSRIYGQDAGEILKRLARKGRYQRLHDILVKQESLKSPWPKVDAKQIADDLGLSNTSLQDSQRVGKMAAGGSVMDKTLDTSNFITPLELFKTHGNTIHLGPCSAIICALCPTCEGKFVCRAAFFKPYTEVKDAVAYRILGLQYLRTLQNGVGIIVQNNDIIGRMVYACPRCPCRPIEQLEVNFPDIWMPLPNQRPNS